MTATTEGCVVFFNAMRRPRPGTCFGHGKRCSDAIGGMRLANVKLSMLIGLGLLGLISVGLLKSQGCRVWGIDVDPLRADLAATFGAAGIEARASSYRELTPR